MSTTTEMRSTRSAVEVRGSDGGMRIGGYALKFNRTSQNLGGFVERVAPTFLNKSMGDGWPGVMARYNHDNNFLLGTTDAGTLRLAVDETGLDYEVDLPSFRSDTYELVTRGDIKQSSFAWTTFEDDWTLDENGFPLRTLISGRLLDVAPVNTPAYLDTSTGLRSLAEQRGMDVTEVQALAAAGDLTRIFTPTPVVIDVRTDSDESPQADATVPPSIQLMQRELALKGKQAL